MEMKDREQEAEERRLCMAKELEEQRMEHELQNLEKQHDLEKAWEEEMVKKMADGMAKMSYAE